MSIPNDDIRRAPPPVEVSQKYMAWNIKEMAESLKIIAMAVKDIDQLARQKLSQTQQTQQTHQAQPTQPSAKIMTAQPPVKTIHDNEEIPF